jgi:hypothetical protein
VAGVGAYTPDWTALINNDAGLKDVQATLAAGTAADQATLGSEIGNAYTTFGKPIDLATLASQLGMTTADIQNMLGPNQQQLAQENTAAGLSTTARLDQANKQATQSTLEALNKRGMLNSGATGTALNQQDLAYRQAESDAYQKFLGFLQQYQQGYASAQNTRAGTLASAESAAADRAVATNRGSAGFTAPWDHTDSNGAPVYKGPDGSLWNADGTPYSAPAPASPPAPAAALPTAPVPYGLDNIVRGKAVAS